jgi:predicted metal-dependent phosphoesterase TrpH
MCKQNIYLIDLHTHSVNSDGTYTPKQIAKEAHEKGLKAVALTDHDCVFGLDEFEKAGQEYGVETISGIEFASYYESSISKKTEIHIVGLLIDKNNKVIIDKTKTILEQRIERNKKMTKRLTELGFPMTYEELCDLAGHNHCSRTHYAMLMVKKGYVKDKNEAFKKYFAYNMPAYVPRILPTPAECIEMIKNAGGIPVLAHPTLYRMNDEQIESMAKDLRQKGMEGIEVMYSTYNTRQQYMINNIAEKYGYLKSGGSDFHGLNKAGISLGTGKGNLAVPYEFLTELKERDGKQ